MKTQSAFKYFTLLLSLMGFISYTNQGKTKEDRFTINFGIEEKNQCISGVSLEEDKISSLYEVIGVFMKGFSDASKQKLGIDGITEDEENQKIKNYLNKWKSTGLLSRDYNPDNPKVPYQLGNNMTLKEAGITNNTTLNIFMPYEQKVTFSYEPQKEVEGYIIIDEPYMDLGRIFDKIENLIKKNSSEEIDSLYDQKRNKIGLTMDLIGGDNLQEIADPINPKKKRVIIKYNSEEWEELRSSGLEVTQNWFEVKPVNQEAIKVKGLHITDSLQDLKEYLTEKGFQPGKLRIEHAYISLENIEENKRLYQANIDDEERYSISQKGDSDLELQIILTNPQIQDDSEIITTTTQTVKELYSEVKKLKIFGKNPQILKKNRLILNTEEAGNQTLESIGIDDGDELDVIKENEIFVTIKSPNIDDDLTGDITIQVKNKKITVQELQNQKENIQDKSLVVLNSEDQIIDPTASLEEAMAGSPYLLFCDPSHIFRYEYHKNNNKKLYNYTGVGSSHNMDLLAKDIIEHTEEDSSIGLLFTEYGKAVNIKNALNKQQDDKVNSILYNPNNPNPIQVSRYEVKVKWIEEGETQSHKIINLYPYSTLKDLIIQVRGKLDGIEEVWGYEEQKYLAADLTSTTMFDVDRGDGKEITFFVPYEIHIKDEGKKSSSNSNNGFIKVTQPLTTFEDLGKLLDKKCQDGYTIIYEDKSFTGKEVLPISLLKSGGSITLKKPVRHRFWYWLGIFAILIIIGGGIWALLQEKIKNNQSITLQSK